MKRNTDNIRNETEYAVVTMWYNEEKLAPYFLSHYSDASKIVVIFDSTTNDRSRSIAKARSIVEDKELVFPDGFDDQLKIETLMAVANQMTTGWVMVVDCDEFVFPPNYSPISDFLLHCKGDIVFARMWNVYRNKNDNDLDPSIPTFAQRRHGSIQRTSGENRWYSKPIIFRPGIGVELSSGGHFFKAPSGTRVSNLDFYGVHWAKADPSLVHRAVEDRVGRHSQQNINSGFGVHHLQRTVAKLNEELTAHLKDPIVVPNRYVGRFASTLSKYARQICTLGQPYSCIKEGNKWHSAQRPDCLDVLASLHLFFKRISRRLTKSLPLFSR